MNERIKELTGKAFDEAVPYAWHNLDHVEVEKVMKKFAELIVKECSKVITNGGYWHHMTKGWSQATPPEIAKMVREHFGVE